MPGKQPFTNDELAQLHLIVSQDCASSRIELNDTAGQPYREYLKRRMAQEVVLLKKMEEALSVLRTNGEDRWASDMFFVDSKPSARVQKVQQ